MDASSSPLQADSAGRAAPDLNDPKVQQEIFDKIRAAYLSAEPEPEAEL